MDYIEYDFTYIQTDYLEAFGDAKAVAYIDAYPMNADGLQVEDGYVVAKVILTTHNDIVVAWTSTEGTANPEVLALVEKAKIEIAEYTYKIKEILQ